MMLAFLYIVSFCSNAALPLISSFVCLGFTTLDFFYYKPVLVAVWKNAEC